MLRGGLHRDAEPLQRFPGAAEIRLDRERPAVGCYRGL